MSFEKCKVSFVDRWAKRAGVVAGTLALAGATAVSGAQAEVTIRLASDTSGLPHPAAIAMEVLKERVEKEIPGSKVRIFVASALSTIGPFPGEWQPCSQRPIDQIEGFSSAP